MASLGSMYRLKPHYNVEGSVVLPDVMYRMKRLVTPPAGLQQDMAPRSLEERQESLLKRLDAMIAVADERLDEGSTVQKNVPRVTEMLKSNCPTDVVIRVNPSQPMLWLGQVKKQLDDKGINTWWKFHTHSSVTTPPSIAMFPSSVPHKGRHQYKLIVTVIWSAGGQCPSLHVDPYHRTAICGETNIFRFFGRILGIYEASPITDAIIDLCLHACDVILSPTSTNQERASILKSISSDVEKGTWFGTDSLQLLASFLASVLSSYGLKNIPQEVLKSWAREQGSQFGF